jgi:hypothetical protein
MKNEVQVREIYDALLKKYFHIFIYDKALQHPENCRFNIRQPIDLRRKIGGEPNPCYNRLDVVEVQCDSINITGDNYSFNFEGKSVEVPQKLVIDMPTAESMCHTTAKVAREYGLPHCVDTIGFCRLDVEKEDIHQELRICDDPCDAINCPAFLNRHTREEIETAFWQHAATSFLDLMVLRNILEGTPALTWWMRVKAFFSFKAKT